uniref:RNA polymerase sigma GP28 factor n=1 Tax=Bacillus phage SP01 TaxID=2884427 RepID=RP28_BPSP1|nr:RecName: Full=RNA polymerase sigma GP28 factor [Bacillus phage SPO1]CAA24664.1 gp28 [Bacillus phage SPO1]
MVENVTYSEDGQLLKLKWEDVYEQFKNLITFAARQQMENNGADTMMSRQDLEQEGLLKLYDCWEKWCFKENKQMDEFGPIFRKSLFRKVKQSGGTGRALGFVAIDDEDNPLENMLKDENTVDVVEKIHFSEGLEKLKETLESDIAKSLLEELINPSDQTIYNVLIDIERKKMLKSQGHRVNVPKDTTVRMKHIDQTLGISNKQYDSELKKFVKRLTIYTI